MIAIGAVERNALGEPTAVVKRIGRVRLVTAVGKAAPGSVAAAYQAIVTPPVGCGPPPPRRAPDAMGISRYVDPAAGKAWDDCDVARIRAAEKDYYDKVVAGKLSGNGGCGPKPPYVIDRNGQVFWLNDTSSGWTGKDLGAAWEACAKRAGVAVPTAQTTSPPIVPGSPVVVSPGLEAQGKGGPVDFSDMIAPSPGVALAPKPKAAVASTFGGSVTAPDSVFLVGGAVVALGVLALILHSKGVI